ncbi:MAG: hypothetical protein ACRDSR_20660 [Pseudonocardiaceae bacterium]
MFDICGFDGAPLASATREEDWFDPAWLDQVPEPPDTGHTILYPDSATSEHNLHASYPHNCQSDLHPPPDDPPPF